jgi:hypothetical protein
MLLPACQRVNETLPSNEIQGHYLWIGDDVLLSGPLDMQTLLMLELSGYPDYLEMQKWVDPKNTLDSSPDIEKLNSQLAENGSELVFLQAFGVQRSLNDDLYLKNAKLWISEIKNQNKQAVLFYPWFSIVDDQAVIDRLNQLVLETAWAENLVLVPVGPAWEWIRSNYPDIQLYAKDGIHPSAEGVYLSACVFYSSITGLSPEGNPVRTSIGYDNPEKIVTLEPKTAARLQKAAWETIQDYLQKDEFQVLLSQTSR